MFKKSQTLINLLIIASIAIFIYFLSIRLQSKTFFLVFFGVGVFILSFLNTDFALLFLVFSMLFSPEFKFGSIGPRDIIIRLDDLFLIVIFLGWLAKMAINKLPLFKKNPLNVPIAIYISVYIFSTLLGIFLGYSTFKNSIFYLLKYFEYFLLYFMVINEIKDKKRIKFFIFCILFVSFIVSLYAIRQRFLGIERVSAPFEEKESEPNTLGGYLLLNIFLLLSIFLNIDNIRLKIISLIFLIPEFFALLYTLSRGSWFGFVLGYIVLFFLTKKNKAIVLFFGLFAIVFYSVIFPASVIERINYTFSPQTERKILGKSIRIDESFAARIDSWDYTFKILNKTPIFGRGAGGARAVIDNQYARILVEIGVVGFFAFFILIFRLFSVYFSILNNFKENDFIFSISCGLTCTLFAFLGHFLSSETFIIIRVMEPFWFLNGLIVKLKELNGD